MYINMKEQNKNITYGRIFKQKCYNIKTKQLDRQKDTPQPFFQRMHYIGSSIQFLHSYDWPSKKLQRQLYCQCEQDHYTCGAQGKVHAGHRYIHKAVIRLNGHLQNGQSQWISCFQVLSRNKEIKPQYDKFRMHAYLHYHLLHLRIHKI